MKARLQKDYPSDAMKPAIAMAMEPANDLSQLYGSFCFPNRLPMMSAKPGASMWFER